MNYVAPLTDFEKAFNAVSCSTAPHTFTVHNIGQSAHYVAYLTGGTVNSLAIEIDGSADNTNWFAISNQGTSITSGIINGNIYLPYIRVNLTACSGSGTVTAYYVGSSVPPSAAGSIGPVPIPPPVSFACNLSAPVNYTGSGDTSVITHSGTLQTHVCLVVIALSGTATFQIDEGTGTNCGTNTVTVWGPSPSTTLSVALPFTTTANLILAAGQDLCMNAGASVTVGGGISYAQF